MRRTALLFGFILLLPACETLVGSPVDGAGGFLADTHSIHLNPNRPLGDSPNMLRVMGKQVDAEPLTPEPGNVWPGPVKAEPTLQDIQRQQNQTDLNNEPPQHPTPRGSSTPPGATPSLPAVPSPGPGTSAPVAPTSPPGPTTRFYPTPGGAAVGSQMGNGVQTYTDPKGGIGIVVPNGNGTSTLVGPDGSVTSVPNPR